MFKNKDKKISIGNHKKKTETRTISIKKKLGGMK